MISTILTLCLLGSSVGLQDDAQRTIIQNDISYQSQPNQEYLVQQRPVLMQNYPQHYVPVPIQLLQRSVYTQQPQAALIIVKAFPVYLTPAQAASIQSQGAPVQQELSPRGPNIQMIHYSSPPAAPVYSTSPPSSVYPTAQPAVQESSSVVVPVATQGNNYASATNPGLYFAPSSSNSAQGDSYLNQLAQAVAQQYQKSPSNFKAPAIITGLENFSPEQQNQIKNHLKSYITSHAEGEKQEKQVFGKRQVDDSNGKFSSKISTSQYSQQTDWRPAHQPGSTNTKN